MSVTGKRRILGDRKARREGALERLQGLLKRIDAGVVTKPNGEAAYSQSDVERMLAEEAALKKRLYLL